MTFAKRVLVVAALLCSGTAYAGGPSWTISESSGSVMVLRPGLSAAATRGSAIKVGDVISTGTNGRAVLVRGGEYLVVSPRARITIADPKPGGMTQIIQSFGNTLYKIKKMATPHFAVETPYLAAVVKGTTFSVTVTPKGASVQVTEGRVEVATPDGGASYLVTPGEIGIVSRDAPYRLRIEGNAARTIESPNRPAAPAPSVADVDPVDLVSVLDGSIAEGVSEGSVQLAALSGGLISGDSAISIATAAVRVAAIGQPVETTAAPPPVGPVQQPNAPADNPTPAAPVPAGVVAVVDTMPTGTGTVVDTLPGAGPPMAAPPAAVDITPPIPPVPTGALPPMPPAIGSDAAPLTPPVGAVPDALPGAPPPAILPPVVPETVPAAPPAPITSPAAPPSIISTIIGAVMGSLPAVNGNGNGNNGVGLGNGGSNRGGGLFGDNDRDDNRGRGRIFDDDDDDDDDERRRGRGRGRDRDDDGDG